MQDTPDASGKMAMEMSISDVSILRILIIILGLVVALALAFESVGSDGKAVMDFLLLLLGLVVGSSGRTQLVLKNGDTAEGARGLPSSDTQLSREPLELQLLLGLVSSSRTTSATVPTTRGGNGDRASSGPTSGTLPLRNRDVLGNKGFGQVETLPIPQDTSRLVQKDNLEVSVQILGAIDDLAVYVPIEFDTIHTLLSERLAQGRILMIVKRIVNAIQSVSKVPNG
jgi:hypothetical protein